jgi:GrpB-like predicted nucleotidyltransferase (UPF0157 family)
LSKRVIEVVDYSPLWANKFEQEKHVLTQLLGSNALGIFHIGSTAVVGLAAKPIIDILIEVVDLQMLDHKRDEIQSAGYEVKGEYGIDGRRYFRKGGLQRTHHIHAFQSGDDNLRRHLAFRDYLIAHPAVASEYANLKKLAVVNGHNNSDSYMAKKDLFVKQHEQLALLLYR